MFLRGRRDHKPIKKRPSSDSKRIKNEDFTHCLSESEKNRHPRKTFQQRANDLPTRSLQPWQQRSELSWAVGAFGAPAKNFKNEKKIKKDENLKKIEKIEKN